MKTCQTCEHWMRNQEDIFKDCSNSMFAGGDIFSDDMILARYGADDNYGSYFRTNKDFGCLLWEEKK